MRATKGATLLQRFERATLLDVGGPGIPNEKTYALNVHCHAFHFGVLAFLFD